jgi:hypothetical protein
MTTSPNDPKPTWDASEVAEHIVEVVRYAKSAQAALRHSSVYTPACEELFANVFHAAKEAGVDADAVELDDSPIQREAFHVIDGNTSWISTAERYSHAATMLAHYAMDDRDTSALREALQELSHLLQVKTTLLLGLIGNNPSDATSTESTQHINSAN